VNQHTDELTVFHWAKGKKNIPLISFEQVAKIFKIAVLLRKVLEKLCCLPYVLN
jgi:hypothetical protein